MTFEEWYEIHGRLLNKYDLEKKQMFKAVWDAAQKQVIVPNVKRKFKVGDKVRVIDDLHTELHEGMELDVGLAEDDDGWVWFLVDGKVHCKEASKLELIEEINDADA
jgi:hypothetical protein